MDEVTDRDWCHECGRRAVAICEDCGRFYCRRHIGDEDNLLADDTGKPLCGKCYAARRGEGGE